MKTVQETQEIVGEAIETTDAALAATVEVKAVSKAELARTIYAEEEGKAVAAGVELVRKDVIARFVAEAGCTKAQAQTYYQTIRKSKGLVNATPAAPVVTTPAIEELYRVRCELMLDIELGIDTADTWIDLDMVNFAISEMTREQTII